LEERLEIDVVVLQECHALCWAEQTFGAARGVDDFAMLDISEGLGLGVMHNGRIVQGHSGLAGELGHMTVELEGRPCGCGNRGCLETVATDTALVTFVGERLGGRVELDEIIAGMQSGTLDCAGELDRVLDYLAVGTAAVVNIFNPQKLFIYGRLLDARADLFGQLLERAERRALAPNWRDCQVVRARGNKRLGTVAAAAYFATHGT
jgi:N-acetylglucosamine repressor